MINTKRLSSVESDNLTATSTGKRTKRRAIARTRNRTAWKHQSSKRTRSFLKTEALTQLNEARLSEIINTTQPGQLVVEIERNGKTEIKPFDMGSFVMCDGPLDYAFHGDALDATMALANVLDGRPVWHASPNTYYGSVFDEDEDEVQSLSIFDEANEWSHLQLKPYELNTCDGYVSCRE